MGWNSYLSSRTWKQLYCLCLVVVAGLVFAAKSILPSNLSNFTAPKVSERLPSIISRDSATADSQKIVLFWTKFHGHKNPYWNFDISSCEFQNCLLTDNRRLVNESDAVVFHVREFITDEVRRDLPTHRYPWQRYVFFLLEPPALTWTDFTTTQWSGFFNLTWTYREDSDVFCENYKAELNISYLGNRTPSKLETTSKLDKALAHISRCDTDGKREKYIEELRKHFPVDVLGDCGQPDPCGKYLYNETCTADQFAKYKFYLSFENSKCKDYITEKAFRPLTFGTVPVVFGGGDYKRVMPPGSYIDTSEYGSPKELADHLWHLAKNPKLYEAKYNWRSNWKDQKLYDPQNVSICKLCKILNTPDFPAKSYDGAALQNWWYNDAQCHSYKTT